MALIAKSSVVKITLSLIKFKKSTKSTSPLKNIFSTVVIHPLIIVLIVCFLE